jgi:hypothetical protein
VGGCANTRPPPSDAVQHRQRTHPGFVRNPPQWGDALDRLQRSSSSAYVIEQTTSSGLPSSTRAGHLLSEWRRRGFVDAADVDDAGTAPDERLPISWPATSCCYRTSTHASLSRRLRSNRRLHLRRLVGSRSRHCRRATGAGRASPARPAALAQEKHSFPSDRPHVNGADILRGPAVDSAWVGAHWMHFTPSLSNE